MMLSTHLNSGLVVELGSGSAPDFSYSISALRPSWMSMVASPPSSTMRSGPSAPGQVRHSSVQSQYSSRVSPFQAKTVAVLALAMAAAAWSCVEKMLHEAQRTSAPISASVSISTPVWMVMCREPVIRMPANGLDGPYSFMQFARPGDSWRARFSSLRPNSAWDISLTLDSVDILRGLVLERLKTRGRRLCCEDTRSCAELVTG